MKYYTLISILCLLGYSLSATAQSNAVPAKAVSPKQSISIEKTLVFNTAILPDYAESALTIKQQGVDHIRKQLPHKQVSIPTTWRLVNVIAAQNRTNANTTGQQAQYTLFFQDEKSRTIYSLSIDEMGLVQTQSAFTIPATTNP